METKERKNSIEIVLSDEDEEGEADWLRSTNFGVK